MVSMITFDQNGTISLTINNYSANTKQQTTLIFFFFPFLPAVRIIEATNKHQLQP